MSPCTIEGAVAAAVGLLRLNMWHSYLNCFDLTQKCFLINYWHWIYCHWTCGETVTERRNRRRMWQRDKIKELEMV